MGEGVKRRRKIGEKKKDGRKESAMMGAPKKQGQRCNGRQLFPSTLDLNLRGIFLMSRKTPSEGWMAD